MRWLTSLHILSIGDEQRTGSIYAYLEWCPRHGGIGMRWGLDHVLGYQEAIIHIGPVAITAGRRTEPDSQAFAAVFNGLGRLDDER